jgi:hypothetical protein
LTMITGIDSINNDSIREIIVKLVCIESISHWNERC